MRAYLHYQDGRVVPTEVDEFAPILSRALFRRQNIFADTPPPLPNIQTTEFQIDIRDSRETGIGIYREV